MCSPALTLLPLWCVARMCSLVLAGAHFLARVGFPMLDSPRFSTRISHTHFSPSPNPLALYSQTLASFFRTHIFLTFSACLCSVFFLAYMISLANMCSPQLAFIFCTYNSICSLVLACACFCSLSFLVYIISLTSMCSPPLASACLRSLLILAYRASLASWSRFSHTL